MTSSFFVKYETMVSAQSHQRGERERGSWDGGKVRGGARNLRGVDDLIGLIRSRKWS